MTAAVLQRIVSDPDRPDRRSVWTLDKRNECWRCPVRGCGECVPAGAGSRRALNAHTRDAHWRKVAA